MKFNIICKCKLRWWVRPLVLTVKLWVLVTRRSISVDRLADFVANHGINKKFVTKEI